MSEPAPDTGIREHLLFFTRFLRNPRAVGAVTVSSRALAEAMVVGFDLARARGVAELGPGTGAITASIVGRIGPDTRFLALEIDPEFATRISARWPSVQCVCQSAERLDVIARECGMLPLDHIISGLPFVSLPPAVTAQISRSIAASLGPGGTFTTFQYFTGYLLPSAVAFRRAMSKLMGSEPTVRLVMRNMPPVFVLTWSKPGDRPDASGDRSVDPRP